MATYVLIHGAGDVGWYWHLVDAELRERGHDVVDAIGDGADLVVVAQSFAGFTAPLVCDRVPVELLVLLAGMIPSPGEAPRDWWANTGYEREGRREGDDDVIVTFYHDVPPELVSEALKRGRSQSGTPTPEPWPSRRGPMCPPGSSSVATTDSSHPTSCAGWYASAWASSPTRSTADTVSPSAARRS